MKVSLSDVSGAGRQNASKAGHKFVATQAAVHPGHLYVLQVFSVWVWLLLLDRSTCRGKLEPKQEMTFCGGSWLLPKIEQSHESSKFRHPKLVSFLT